MEYSKLPKIGLDGAVVREDNAHAKERFLVYVAGKRMLLRGRQFRIFTLLALAVRNRRNDGWVHTSTLGAGHIGHYVYLLRLDIREACRGDFWLEQWAERAIQRDGHGGCRLDARPDRIVVGPDLLANYEDADIAAAVKAGDKRVTNG